MSKHSPSVSAARCHLPETSSGRDYWGLLSSFLPELVSGRGTARRVVEGETLHAGRNDPLNHGTQIGQHFTRRNAQGRNASLRKPRIARRVTSWPVTHAMPFAVDFNGKVRIVAKEVEHI